LTSKTILIYDTLGKKGCLNVWKVTGETEEINIRDPLIHKHMNSW